MQAVTERTAVVVAHADDEILWAGSAVPAAERIIVCYGETPYHPAMTEGRRRVLAEFPHDAVECLDLVEASSFNSAAWSEPAEAPYGLAQRALVRLLVPSLVRRYRENFDILRDRLASRLAGCRTVITHNPWGEYGHEDHVQVFRAVEALRAALGFELWVTCYVGPKSVAFQRRHLDRLGPCSAPLPIDQGLMQRIKALYIENRCWTWFDDYRWPETEVLYRWPRRDADQPGWRVAACPFIMVDPGWQKPSPLDEARRLRRGLAARLRARRP
jgi:hypothetical protein